MLYEVITLSFCVSYFNKFSYGRFPVLDKESRLVGIVTASDVISTLLVALNREVDRLEHAVPSEHLETEAGSPTAERVIEFKTEPFNFENAGSYNFV